MCRYGGLWVRLVIILCMPRSAGKVHVVRVKKSHVNKQGRRREYQSVYLRRTYRDGGKVCNETVANLSVLPEAAVAAVEATLKGQTLVAAGSEFTLARSLRHGDVAAMAAMARKLGLAGLLGPAGRARDLVVALIVSRVVRPKPKLSTLSWWADTTLGVDLGVAEASTDEIYAAMDWLVGRQEAIEKTLADKHLAPEVNPSRMALFDLTSSWVTGRCCELAARGYSRDGKKGCEQIEYGVLCDPQGRPVAVRVFGGNTADPQSFTEIVTVVKDKLAIDKLVLVGDRGMITSARIDALRELSDNPDTPTDFDWITALRAPAIAKLARDDGPLQMSLFDAQDLAEITHPDYPGERLIACRNPALAAERARKREDLLQATEKLLAAITKRVAAGTWPGPTRSARPTAKPSAPTRWASTSTARSPTPPSPTSVTTTASPPKPPSTASTCCAPASRRHPRSRRRGGRLQEPRQHRTRLSHHQIRRPRPTADPPPPRRPRQSTRADLHARLLPHLAPTKGLGATDLHRRNTPHPGQPRRPRAAFRSRQSQSLHQTRRSRQPAKRVPRPARPPRDPHPRPDPLPRHQHRNRQTHRGHPHPAPRLRTHRYPDPPHYLRVAKTTTHRNQRIPRSNRGFT